VDPALGISDGIHYIPRSSAESLLGGFRWVESPEGGFTLDCSEGRGGAHHAAPLDRYMMGLVGAGAVPPVRVSAGSIIACGAPIDQVALTVTIEDIQAAHGVRTPGPAAAQRDFALAFVAESRGRLLDATEMTFYDILAAHYTRPVPAEQPDPYQGNGQWASIARFFGEGTTWRSDIVTCGNGTVEGDEECDDGNRVPGDGCDASCRRETPEVVIGTRLGTLPAINPRSNSVIAVAVLGADGFDPGTVDRSTVRFGPTGTEAAPLDSALRDVDGDRRLDLALRFKTRDTRITCAQTYAILTGRFANGTRFVGSAPLELHGCR
jgi:cysteine-rich repeat protein